MDLSLCIVTYQVKDYLRGCLESLLKYPPERLYEVIVADNRSTDGTIEMLQREYPFVHIIQSDGNEGYAKPMNRALRLAQGRYVVQLNPDTQIFEGTFDKLMNFMDANPQVGICTPKVLNRDGTLQKQCRRSEARPWDTIAYFSGLSRFFPRSRLFGGYLQSFYDEDQIHPVQAVSGSCMVIRREVIEQIGYLDESFFAYQEDTDYCMRARKAGWQIYYVPTAQIIHYGGKGGSRQHPYRSTYYWHRSYYLYYRKHLAQDYFFIFNWLYYLAMAAKLGVALIATFVRRDKYVGTKKP